MSTAVLKIEGMTCNHCVAAVERALKAQDGVRSARVDLETGTAEVDLDGAVGTEQLTSAVEEEGYAARVLS